jgi:hypothetical protein
MLGADTFQRYTSASLGIKLLQPASFAATLSLRCSFWRAWSAQEELPP